MKISVLDLGLNNLSSLLNALADSGADTALEVVSNAQALSEADLIVIPGTGSFGAAVEALTSSGLFEAIGRAATAGTRVLGICLGMQLLGSHSEESPDIKGLGLIGGATKRLEATQSASVPNVGWAELYPSDNAFALDGFTLERDFYFVHSYYFEPEDEEDVLFLSRHGDFEFTSGVLRGNVMGLQFHPEKSSTGGAALLKSIRGWVNA